MSTPCDLRNDQLFHFSISSCIVAVMSRIAQIACVVIFIAVMVAINRGASSFMSWMGGDFALGFGVGAICALGLALLIQKLEAGKAAGSVQAGTQKKHSRDIIDL